MRHAGAEGREREKCEGSKNVSSEPLLLIFIPFYLHSANSASWIKHPNMLVISYLRRHVDIINSVDPNPSLLAIGFQGCLSGVHHNHLEAQLWLTSGSST